MIRLLSFLILLQGGLAGDVVTRRITALAEALGQEIRIEH